MVTFTDRNLATQWGEKFFASVYPSLTDEEIEALKAYKYGGYSQINRMLRDNAGEVIPFPLTDEWALTLELDSAIAKSPLPEAVTLFRGQTLSTRNLAAFDAGTLIGEVIENIAFSSTTLLKEEAVEYFLQSPQRSVILQSEVEAGLTGIYLDVPEIESLNQCEILLPRDMGWKVTGMERDSDNRRIVIATLVFRG